MSLLDTLPTTPKPGADTLRLQAHRALAEQGLPNKKTEAWRFTDVRELVSADLAPSPSAPQVSALPQGVELETREDALSPLLASEYFVALNTALFDRTQLVSVKGEASEPLTIVYRGERSGATYPRMRVELAPNASLTLVERFEADGDFTDQVVEIVLAEGARCEHIRVHSDAGRLVSAVAVKQGRSSSYRSHVVSLGGALTRLDLRVSLEGEGAECNLRGAFHTRGTDHVDHHVRVDHVAPRCTSHQEYRGLLDDKSTAVFDGQAIVHRTAPGSEAHQLSRNLLLSRSANVFTKPHLEIDHDDVIASHGATVGALDENEIFYLRSRGIPEADARALLTFAFVRAIVDSLPVPELREELEAVLEERLERGGR